MAEDARPISKNERIGLGAIGMRYQGSVITEKALPHGDLVAICDVDRHVREQARASFGSTAAIHEHYHDLLNGIILDTADRELIPQLQKNNVQATTYPVLMKSLDDKIKLAEFLLDWSEEKLL